jgi:hypothetical protein
MKTRKMMKSRKTLPICSIPLTLAALLASVNVQAHQFWIEQGAAGATLQFGEFADNVRETSPGLLDSLGRPGATRIDADAEQRLTLNKTASGYTLTTTALPAPAKNAGASILAFDLHYPVSSDSSTGAPIRWAYTPAARYVTDLSKRQPKLAFDIVPTGRSGQFRVTLNGKPMPKIKVAAVVPSGWTRQAHTDADGMVSFALPWRGLYVIEAVHDDKTAGVRDGKPYDIASYSTSLSFAQAGGVAALPGAPAGAPGK